MHLQEHVFHEVLSEVFFFFVLRFVCNQLSYRRISLTSYFKLNFRTTHVKRCRNEVTKVLIVTGLTPRCKDTVFFFYFLKVRHRTFPVTLRVTIVESFHCYATHRNTERNQITFFINSWEAHARNVNQEFLVCVTILRTIEDLDTEFFPKLSEWRTFSTRSIFCKDCLHLSHLLCGNLCQVDFYHVVFTSMFLSNN